MERFLQFNYLERPGIRRTAYLTPPHFPSTPVTNTGTDDPQLMIIRDDGSKGGPHEKLTYLGTDGRIWFCTVHAEYQHTRHQVKIWLEDEAEDGEEHDDSIRFAIVDWNGIHRELEIDEWTDNDKAPGFHVWK
ncbi:hypothetical protein [Chryseobacterium sp. CP-77]|uniref:hypothetical protein n=1 Tax=Chryseobacterium sp. CP-77 TaxID=3116594 RepID=UPI002ED0B2E4